MQFTLPLDEMTIADKLNALEAIWASMKHDPKDVPLPGWHADVLAARRMRAKEGSSTYGDWADAKRRLHGRLR